MRFPRSSGILLHPTSLPSRHGIGDLGEEAHAFVNFLAETGQRWWQMLPFGPTGFGNSPYQSHSSFAGNPLLINLDDLVARKWLSTEPRPSGSGSKRGSWSAAVTSAYRLNTHACRAASK